MEEKKLTDEEIAKAILQSIEYSKTITYFDEWGNCKSIFMTDILDLIHRLQKENKELKSPKFASWKLKFFNLKEEFDKELSEHEEFTKKAKAEIERLTEKQNDYRANTELFRNSCKFWEEKFQGAMQVNDELQKKADELKEERENMQAVIFGLEEDKRLLQKQVDELKIYLASEKVCSKQAVKTMAKEILQELWDETEPLNESHKWVRLRIKNIASRKGVEVE